MTGWIMATQLILGLSILVTLHELGHFWTARAFGIRVERFFLFFDAWGYKLFSFKRGDTEYGIGWLPLGGYVKIAGMIDESMDAEAMKKPAQPWEFRSKPAWQRLIVMVGGVTMNVILSVSLYWMLTYKYGETYLPNSEVKNGIVAYELAQNIGLKTGDKITAINGEPFERFEDLFSSKVLFGNSALTILRDGQTLQINVPADFPERLNKKSKDNFIGPRRTIYVKEVAKNMPAERAGIKENDVIIAIDTNKIRFNDDLEAALKAKAGKHITLSVLRNGLTIKLQSEVNPEGIIGCVLATKDFNYKVITYNLFEALPKGAKRAWTALTDNIKGFGKIFRGEVSASNSMQGPIGIAHFYGGVWDWERFWSITALLSMVLAFMNILPIPALDGGHVIFLSIESITHKRFSDTFMERVQMAGMVILITLMVLILGNDVWKQFLR